MRMLRTTPFFPHKSGEKPYLEVLSRFGLWRDFLNDTIQATISAFRLIKNMSINPKSVEFHQCHANPHSICFFITISKRTNEIFAEICWQLKTPTRTWKYTRCIFCKWATCTRQTFLSKTFAKSLNIPPAYRNNTKKIWEKSNDAYSLSTRVQSTINHRFRFLRFLRQYQRQRKCFLSERALKKALRDTLTRAAWLGPSHFWLHWFALSMRMQVILDSSFARPGWAPIWGGKKGEFGDWTTPFLTPFLLCVGKPFAGWELS